MTANRFPALDAASIVNTRDALHAYARLLGNWLKLCHDKRKHWWHASLRPSLHGLSTGVVYAAIDFELEVNMRESLLQVRTSTGRELSEPLQGQPVSRLAEISHRFLVSCGLNEQSAPEIPDDIAATRYPDYSPEQAERIADALSSVAAVMTDFRAGIREETSPIQLWPHHFDLSVLWLPGDKVPEYDPDDEEYADRQMNFGFTFGDEGIPEPYFYVTAYPLPDTLPGTPLPSGTTWQSDGFSGAVILYKTLIENNDEPERYLVALWNTLLEAGREAMMTS